MQILKKISQLSIIISLLLFSQSIYAIGNRIITFKPVNVLITNQIFVFKEAYGSLEDDFDDVYKEVNAFLVQNGVNTSRKAILYIDYGVTKTNPSVLKSNININEPLMKYLNDTYGESTLKSYRRVLVGYFVAPQYFVATREPFKEYGFKNIRVTAIQSMDKDVKTPLSVLQENGETIKDDAIDVANKDSYTKPYRLYDKIAMMNYLSLNNTKNHIGLIELYDAKLRVYTFIAVPGDQEKFIRDIKLSKTIKEGGFKKRADVVIEETIGTVAQPPKKGNVEQAPEKDAIEQPKPKDDVEQPATVQ